MGHADASRKSPKVPPWETLSLRLSTPISAPLLTAAQSWRYEEEKKQLSMESQDPNNLQSLVS